MVKKTFKMTEKILHFPIFDGGKRRYVQIYDVENNNAPFAEFYVSLQSQKPHEYYPLYLQHMAGNTVELCCMDEDAPEDLFDAILAGGTIEERPELYPNIYKEPIRQKIHFSSRRGWLNDPNGLVYVDGKFHLSYQHNPLGNVHGGVNVCWGLATSEDGVHFTEYPDIIMPCDSKTHIASGSAVVDVHNVSGKGEGTILAAYTALESQMFEGRESVGTRGQMLVYSTDGGYTFHHYSDTPIIPVKEGTDWRDPEILAMDDGSLCIAVYETYEGKYCISFYSSTDCKKWEFRSRVINTSSTGWDLYECPDLFRILVSETDEELWVLYGANGKYRVGTFDNYEFVQIGEANNLDFGDSFWAGQTWNSHPDKYGRYHTIWVTDGTPNGSPFNKGEYPFNSTLSVMCRLTLHKTRAGYRLFRVPVDAFETLRCEGKQSRRWKLEEGCKTAEFDVSVPGEVILSWNESDNVRITMQEKGFTYLADERKLVFTSGREYLMTPESACMVRILVDVQTAEFFVCGEIAASFVLDDKDRYVKLESDNAEILGEIWELSSIWT